ncbi:unnamed protein product [Rangifer tarandus platyrhynchus]|uniref:Uncharacterized protein n=2 Tax=Rangifer tarandus platyrhynchus TaxID=3082113 RepID=A0ABN8ZRM0_RANTA|nr:unnamed protein product [Rangifer tarandus platyrhynchus]CAI9710080.1 unnamed protein product [Rangifer tarandus platyrhynchus]
MTVRHVSDRERSRVARESLQYDHFLNIPLPTVLVPFLTDQQPQTLTNISKELDFQAILFAKGEEKASREAALLKKRPKTSPGGLGGGGRWCVQPVRRAFVHRVGAGAAESPVPARQCASGQRRPVHRGPLALASGLTPGPPPAGADANRLSPLRPPRLRRVRAGPRVFANGFIDFSSIRLLALALETSKGRLVGQRPAASGGLAPHTRVQAVRLIIFPEEAESLQLPENLLF